MLPASKRLHDSSKKKNRIALLKLAKPWNTFMLPVQEYGRSAVSPP
jgi:hypothetical protein